MFLRIFNHEMNIKLKLAYFFKEAMTGGPIVILGTKLPSITSICNKSAPAFSTQAISSPIFEKSAAKREGAILINLKHFLFTLSSRFNSLYILNFLNIFI